jgi:hypothetical protein
MPALAGAIADPGQYNTDIGAGAIIRRTQRTSDSSGATTTELGVLQLESVAVKSGRAYWIGCSTLSVSGGAGDVVGVRIRYTTDGSTATIASTVLKYQQTTIRTGTPDEPLAVGVWYFPVADQNLSVLLTVARIAGSAGSALIQGASDVPIQMVVEDRGVDPGDTGISL